MAASLLKVKQILRWFEDQDILSFYASSLLFVYDGSWPQTNTNLVDGKVSEKTFSKELFTDVEVPEYNNNISVLSSVCSGNGEQHEEKLSRIYTGHKKTCPKRLHSQAFLEEETEKQERAWKSHNSSPPEHLNGNLLSKLENVLCRLSTESRENLQIDVRMIDFAHVFPSNEKDSGYIYGLKNLISVLQSILNE